MASGFPYLLTVPHLCTTSCLSAGLTSHPRGPPSRILRLDLGELDFIYVLSRAGPALCARYVNACPSGVSFQKRECVVLGKNHACSHPRAGAFDSVKSQKIGSKKLNELSFLCQGWVHVRFSPRWRRSFFEKLHQLWKQEIVFVANGFRFQKPYLIQIALSLYCRLLPF